jgi:glucokinase
LVTKSQHSVRHLLGLDIGGTHVTAGLIRLADSSLVPDSLVRMDVNSKGSAEEIIAVWVGTISRMRRLFPGSFEHIGIAMPGPFDYEAGISLIMGFDKYESIFRMNIRQVLADRLGISPLSIRFKNDAAAFLEGEVLAGAARGCCNCIGVTLGTGLGSAWSVNGRTEDAELSVTPYLDGIAEDYLSTRWFVKRYFELTGKTVCNTKALVDCFDGNAAAAQVFEEFSGHFAVFLDSFIRGRQPDMLVIGGNMAKAAPLFLEQTRTKLSPAAAGIRIRLATLGETAALIGGAGCWKEEYETA